MSFDLKIFNGDLVIGTNGDFSQVKYSEKLIQDILKILMTETGTNVHFQWYGSLLSASMVGSPYDTQFIATVAENQIRSSLETIQNLQKEQATRQFVSPSELLAAIKSVNVIRNQIDPTFFSINLAVLTKNLTIAKTSFNVTL